MEETRISVCLTRGEERGIKMVALHHDVGQPSRWTRTSSIGTTLITSLSCLAENLETDCSRSGWGWRTEVELGVVVVVKLDRFSNI